MYPPLFIPSPLQAFVLEGKHKFSWRDIELAASAVWPYAACIALWTVGICGSDVHMFPRALALMRAGKIDAEPLITDHYVFAGSVAAFECAAHPAPTGIKVQIDLPA